MATHESRSTIKIKWQTIQSFKTIEKTSVYDSISARSATFAAAVEAETNLKPIWKLITQFFFLLSHPDTQSHLHNALS